MIDEGGLAGRLLGGILILGLTQPVFASPKDDPANSGTLRRDGRRVTADEGIPAYIPGPPLTGDLHIVGGLSRPPGSATAAGPSTADTLVELWVEIFKRSHPSVRVHTALYASGTAAGALAEQSTQLGVAARELLPHELFLFRNKPFKPRGVPVAGGSYDSQGVTPSQAVVVNKDNPVERLTLAQLDAIFSKSRKRAYAEDITRWGQLGLSGEWADKPIDLYGFPRADGISYFFALRALNGGEFKDSLREETKQDLLVQRVEENRQAIAFVNRGYVRPSTKVVALGETEAGPFRTGSFEEVVNGTYPLSRVIYMYVNDHPGKPVDPLAKEFLRAVLSLEGQQAAARSVYLPLSLVQVRESLRRID